MQRVGNGEAFQLPANLSHFGGGSGQSLPTAVRQKMESFFNTSFSDVRVHVGSQASSIGALAFTHGSNLYFAPGQYNPSTAQGQQLLAHELTHVVQQRAGRVRNPFGSGVAVVQDRNMEAEAARMGLRAVAHQIPIQTRMQVTASLQTRPSRAAHTSMERAACAPLGAGGSVTQGKLAEPWDDFKKEHIVYGIQADRTLFVAQVSTGLFSKFKPPAYLFNDKLYDLEQEVEEDKRRNMKRERDFRETAMNAYPEAFQAEAKDNPNLLWRKKSKAGLLFAAQKGIIVHFVLDKMGTLAAQVGVTTKKSPKATFDKPEGRSETSFMEGPEYWSKERSITGSELRWVYRMRHDPKVKESVQFWKTDDGNGGTFSQCPPPWEWGGEIGEVWRQYEPRLEGFYSDQLK